MNQQEATRLMIMAATIAQKSRRREPLITLPKRRLLARGAVIKTSKSPRPDEGVARGDHARRAEGGDSNAGDDEAGWDHFRSYGGHTRFGDDAR